MNSPFSTLLRVLFVFVLVLSVPTGVGAVDVTDTVDDTTDTTDGATDSTTDTVDDTTDDTTDTTDDATDSTTDTVDDTTDDTTDTTDDATDDTTDTTEASNETTETVNETTAAVNSTVEQTQTRVNATAEPVNATTDAVEAVTDTVQTDDLLVTTNLTELAAEENAFLAVGVAGETATISSAEGGLETATPTDTHSGREPASEEAIAPTNRAQAATHSEASAGLSSPGTDGTSDGPVAPLTAGAAMLGTVGALSGAGRQALTLAQSSPGVTSVRRSIAARRDAGGWRERLWRVLGLFGYQRYDDSDPLEHDAREAICELLRERPGTYLSEISDQTDIPLPTVRYHLKILRHENLVFGEKMRGKRRFFPAGTEPSTLAATLDDGEGAAAVLEALARHGPDSVSGLAETLGRDVSTVSHHLTQLAEDGLVEREREGRAVVNRLAPAARNAFEHGGRESESAAVSPSAKSD